jgi:PAS domain S-box-containing protein
MESAVNFRKWILPAIVVPLLLSCILWAVLLGQGVHLLSELDRVGQSDRLIARVHATSRSLTDRETARLGCRVEGSPDLLRAYREADVRLGGDLDELARLVSGDPERSGRLARLRGPSGPRSRDAGEVIGLRVGSPGGAREPGGDTEGRRRDDEMRDSLADFLAAEEGLRDRRTDATRSRSWAILSAGTGTAVFLGSILAFSSRRLVRRCGAAEAERVELQSRFDRQERENLSLLSEAMKYYAIFRLDPEGRIASWNEDAERILGYRAEEVLARRPFRFYTPEDVKTDVFYRELEWAGSEGRVEQERWVIRKGGFRFKARVATVAIREANGDLSGYTFVVHEIE